MDEPKVKFAIRRYFEKIPNVSATDVEFKFIENGCTCDVIAFVNNKIKYIIECKGSLSPGDIAGGIGQAYQYFYQKKYNSSVANDAEVFFACPYDMEKYLNIMQIPKEIQILLVDNDKNIILYKSKKNKSKNKVIQIEGTTYLEATKIKDIKHIISVLYNMKNRDKNEFKKMMVEKNNKINDPRNYLISLRSLGLVESNNYSLTPKGYYFYGLLNKDEKEFNIEIIKLLYPSLIVVIDGIIRYIKDTNQLLSKFTFTYKELETKINDIYGAEVNYFDHRRLTYPIKILLEINVLSKTGKYYSLNKVNHLIN
jgi:hypothetical protein